MLSVLKLTWSALLSEICFQLLLEFSTELFTIKLHYYNLFERNIWAHFKWKNHVVSA